MKKCCGLRLNTAGVVVGSMFVILALYASVHSTYTFARSLGRERENYRFRNRYIDTESVYFHVFCMFCSVITLISSILLVVGAVKNKHKYLIPWLIVGMLLLLGLIACLVLLIHMYTIYLLNNGKLDFELIIQFLGNVLAIILQSYLWRLVQHLYRHIEDNRERQKVLPTTEPLYSPKQMLYYS